MNAPSDHRLSAGGTLLLLFLANVLNYADRALLGVVVDPVKHDLALSDTEISIVSGAVFTIFNLVMGLYIARWVDVGNRKRILLLGITLWTAATALTGAAQDFWTLAVCRIMVGVGEATCFPVAISMLADLYARDRRPRAFAIFQSSVFLGIVAGSILAGVLAAAHGWRAMFAICGIAGVALLVLIGVTMREPARTNDTPVEGQAPAPEELGRALRHLMHVPGFAMLCLGVGISAMPISILPIWAPTFLMRSHDVPLASVGALIGLPVGIGGVAGTVLAGILASAICRRRGGERHGLLVPIAALPLAAPLYVGFLLLAPLPAVVTCVFFMNFLLSSVLGPGVAAAVGIAPTRMRAVASTLVLVATGVLGSALAPTIVGVASDALAPELGAESLRYAMAIMAGFPVLAAILLWVAYRQITAHKS